MVTVFVGLGSNLGDGRQNIRKAWQKLGAVKGIRLLRLSSPYLTEPVGIETSSWFTNAVGLLQTTLSPRELLGAMLKIEAEMGRDRTQTEDRPVDLDILYYGDLVCNEPDLVIPHPDLQNRLFVLAPLEELAADLPHPVSAKTTAEMRRALSSGPVVIKKSWQKQGDTP